MQPDQLEALHELRAHHPLPPEIGPLAVQAAECGRLTEAMTAAVDAAARHQQGRSLSSAMTTAAAVPLTYSDLPNYEATFYALLKRELHRVLGLPMFDPYEG